MKHLFSVFVLAFVLTSCDPHSTSIIRNDTKNAIEVQLTLDPSKFYKGDNAAPAYSYLVQLQEMAMGDGVELLGMDSTHFVGQYQIASGGFMVAHSSLGRKPYFCFHKMAVLTHTDTLRFSGDEQILKQFDKVRDFDFEFVVR